MQTHSYKTISGQSEGMYKEKGSKFLGFAIPVESEEHVKAHLIALRKKYFDARHHCYAYAIGKEDRKYRANDDGEPNHSAGDPILGQIRSKHLTDILIVVVRYFGGVKLGVGGLITAYKKAAEDALVNNRIVERDVTVENAFEYPSEEMPLVMKLVKDFELKILSQDFSDLYTLTFQVKSRLNASLLEKVLLQQKLGSAITLKKMDDR